MTLHNHRHNVKESIEVSQTFLIVGLTLTHHKLYNNVPVLYYISTYIGLKDVTLQLCYNQRQKINNHLVIACLLVVFFVDVWGLQNRPTVKVNQKQITQSKDVISLCVPMCFMSAADT